MYKIAHKSRLIISINTSTVKFVEPKITCQEKFNLDMWIESKIRDICRSIDIRVQLVVQQRLKKLIDSGKNGHEFDQPGTVTFQTVEN